MELAVVFMAMHLQLGGICTIVCFNLLHSCMILLEDREEAESEEEQEIAIDNYLITETKIRDAY